MPFLKSAPTIEQFVNDVKNLMLEAAARASAVFTSAKFQSDTFKDATGINSGTSSGYTHRGASNYDVILNAGGSTKESYTGEPNDIYWIPGTSNGLAQIFTTTSAYNIGSVDLKVNKSGSPTGNYRVRLYAVSGGVPTGSYLAQTAALSVASLPGTATVTTFTFTSSYALSNATQYAIVIEADGTVTGNGSNYIVCRGNTSSGYSGGTSCDKNSSNVWSALGGDLYFATKEGAASSADIRSVTLTLPAAVTQVVMCADVTLNTGTATYYVSTDGGTNWTTVALADLARIISVPSGLSLVARVVLTGNAELEFLSIAAAA